MKAITLWQPWASFISLGWKTIETRTHKKFFNLLDQTIGIHAGNKWDKDWEELAGLYLDSKQIHYTENEIKFDFLTGNIRGKILCTARVYKVGYLTLEHSQAALIDCGFSYIERTGLFLSDVKQLIPPFDVKGHQGIFNVELPEGII
jgi:hypothetical protein